MRPRLPVRRRALGENTPCLQTVDARQLLPIFVRAARVGTGGARGSFRHRRFAWGYVQIVLDWFFGLMTPAQWDALRNWLTTVGGLIALLIAANTYRRNVRIKREEQARLVYSKLKDVAFPAPGATFRSLTNGAQIAYGSPASLSIPNPDPADRLKLLELALEPIIESPRV